MIEKTDALFYVIHDFCNHTGTEFITHYDICVYSENPECGETHMGRSVYHYRQVLWTSTVFVLTATNDSSFLWIGCTYTYTVSYQIKLCGDLASVNGLNQISCM